MSRIDEINQEILRLIDEREKIQDTCSHPPLARTYKYGSNTGNYDPHADSYWIDHACTLCGRRWTTDQARENHPPEGAREVK
ncbi:hypothetical protein AAY80_151 [Stenotrophomonas phage vB_SmaS-DLP_6]|nr:hypothetical protein AAY80_151 [Stenotrophomonas phage vB_SmaS-DLP_6]